MANFCADNDISVVFLVEFHDKTRYTDWMRSVEWITREEAMSAYITHIDSDGYRKRILGISCYISENEMAIFDLRFRGIISYEVVTDE